MRFPGTINLIGNSLPTPEYLEKQRALKQRRHAIRDGKVTDDSKKDKPNGKIANNSRGSQKGDRSSHEKDDDAGDEQSAADFTEAQDKTIIDMKVKNAPWKAIATETGKEVHQVKTRFKLIKPDDFDKRCREHNAAEREEKAKTKGGGGFGGEDKQEKEKKEKEEQGQQGGGKKGKKKNKGQCPPAETAKKDEEGGDGEADEWWERPDGNWSKEELEALMDISNDELRNAFVMISMRLSKELGKDVHPVSVAEKILGTKPGWM